MAQPLIFISSESKTARRKLAEDLAKKLGCRCLCREDLVDDATKAGIPVGKLEVAMTRSPAMSEKLARQKERYLSFITATLCEMAKDQCFVYHGRAGHLLLQGIPHILRVRLVIPHETRIVEAMEELRLGREKAVEYVKNVDEDIDRWVRYFYGINRNEPGQYDVVINLENMSIPNASAMLCSMAQLPDFQTTPASLRTMENRTLEAFARKCLAMDPATAAADLKVRADDGVVTVTYMPRQPGVAEKIPQVLEKLEKCKQVMCTMASTNILWIQEKFDPQSQTLQQLNEIAKRWDAAIELARFTVPADLENMYGSSYTETIEKKEEALAGAGMAAQPKAYEYNGGIEDDVETAEQKNDEGGVLETIQELVNLGRSGGATSVRGNFHSLLSLIRKDVNYSLVVIGDLFLAKSHESRLRLRRELGGYLADRLNIPVIASEELQQKYLVGKKQFLKLAVYGAVVALIYSLIFHFQGPLISFLGATGEVKDRVLRMLFIILIVPVVAFLYGAFAGLFLKFLKFE
jgi:cytidylate kinase